MNTTNPGRDRRSAPDDETEAEPTMRVDMKPLLTPTAVEEDKAVERNDAD